MCLYRFYIDLKLKRRLSHCKCHGYQSVETVWGDNSIFRFKNFKNSLLQSDKVALGIEAKLMDVCDSQNSNRVKKT